MGMPSGIDIEEYSAGEGAEPADDQAKKAPEATGSASSGDSGVMQPGSPIDVLYPYMRKCLYSIVDVLTADNGKVDMKEKTRQLDLHLAALCAIAYAYGKDGKKPDTLEILDDGSVVKKNHAEEGK